MSLSSILRINFIKLKLASETCHCVSINKIEKPLNVMQLKQNVEHDVWYFSSRSIQEKYLDTCTNL